MCFEELDNRDIWRLDRVKARYQGYCQRYNVDHQEVSISGYYLERPWTASVLKPLIDRMKQGDLAAAEIGIEMIEEDRGLIFGPIVKSNIPRALAKCFLTEQQKERVRRRTVEMLLRKFMPKEFRQYAWLTRRIGLESWRNNLEQDADRTHPWVNWYLRYLLEQNPPSPPRPVWR